MTTAVDRPNRAKLQQGIDIYRDHVREFIVRELGKRGNGRTVEQMLLEATRDAAYERRRSELAAGKSAQSVIDVSDFPHIVSRHWQGVFYHSTNGNQQIRNRMFLIAEGRNQVAHPDESDISMGYVYGRLDDISRVLGDIRAVAAAKQVDEIASQLYKAPAVPETPDQQRTDDQELDTKAPTKSNGLKPWREVIRPRRDVISGELTNNTFAADLQRVADAKSATDEYTNPIDFFNRSFITPGLQSLLVNTLKRINGLGGEPVVQMKTGFGGGKTHSLIALYHLISSTEELAELATDPSDHTGKVLEQVFYQAGVNPEEAAQAKVAVLSGTVRSATEDARTRGRAHALNTLWGYMADDLGGEDAYEFVRLASEKWTSPGGQEIDDLFKAVGPCVILMDELVAYARVLADGQSANFYTFLQALTESAARQQNVAIVVTVPEANDELGGEKGIVAAGQIGKILERIESISAPLDTHEAFEVVRRRLFEDSGIDNDALEATANRFARMYSQFRGEFPQHASNPEYVERIKSCYPVHPELFDRLFDDWAGIPKFQKTRGVLRLMAIAIRRLHNTNSDPLIMPASLKFADPKFSPELMKNLVGSWQQAVDEIDGDDSRSDRVDQRVEQYQQCGDGAAKRVARTVMFGSVPAALAGKTTTGLDEEHIRLGTVQPGEGYTVYDEARNRLTRELYHLHSTNDRYYFHASPNLLKVQQDIVTRISDEERDDRIRMTIQESVPRRIDDDIAIVPCPESSYEINDDDQVKLVILHPRQHLPSRKSENDTATAIPFIEDVMAMYGESRRTRRNMLTFLAAKRDSIVALRREVANLMAWENLSKNREGHRLNAGQIKEANAETVACRQKVDDLLLSAYKEVIAPTQLVPTKPDFKLQPTSVANRTRGNIATDAIETLKEREALVHEIGLNHFESMLDQYFWNQGIDHLEISDIWNSITQQVYLPRLINRGVLETAINKAVKELDYEIADGYEDDQYKGLSGSATIMDRPRLLVKGDAARAWRQLQAESEPAEHGPGQPTTTPSDDGQPSANTTTTRSDTAPTKKLITVSASKTWTGQSAIDGDYNQVRDYMVKSLGNAGGKVRVTITVEGDNPDGFTPLAMNIITESSEQLNMQIEFGD